MEKAAIILSLSHLIYYLYFYVGSIVIHMARSRNINPSMTVLRLMEDYNVDVRMFNYEGKPYGFAWFRKIWLNVKLENLRKKDKKPDWMLIYAFHHEHYHVMKHHKAWILAMRFFLALVPCILFVNWILCIIVYVVTATVMYKIEGLFEEEADNHAEYMMDSKVTKKVS